MDFILPPSLPDGGVPWEKVLPPLIPRLNGMYGNYQWSPKLLIPESDKTSSAEVGYFLNLLQLLVWFINCLRTI